MLKQPLFAAALLLFIHLKVANAIQVDLFLGADDYGKLYIDNQLVESYDVPSLPPLGPPPPSPAFLDLSPGWHDIRIDYQNRYGMTGLYFYWKDHQNANYTIVPRQALRSLDASGNYISGLQATYSNGITIYGEGPIANGWYNMYQGQTSTLWAGMFDVNLGIFGESLTGQIRIGCPLGVNPLTNQEVSPQIVNNGRAMLIKFKPNTGSTLNDLASSCGYSNFNWLSIITYHSNPNIGNYVPVFDPIAPGTPAYLSLWGWHDNYPYYFDQITGPSGWDDRWLYSSLLNNPDAYTFEFFDEPYDRFYFVLGHAEFRTYLVGVRSLGSTNDFHLICFDAQQNPGSGCALEWKSNNTGWGLGGASYAGNLDETSGGAGGIFDVKAITLEDVSLSERSLLVSAGVSNIDFAQIPLRVKLDIKPDSSVNPIDPSSKGNIPVAILSSGGFDVASVDISTVKFGPSGAVENRGQGHIEDVDGDGVNDLVLHFATQDTGIKCTDTSATLTGKTFSGQSITGSDSIKTVSCQ